MLSATKGKLQRNSSGGNVKQPVNRKEKKQIRDGTVELLWYHS